MPQLVNEADYGGNLTFFGRSGGCRQKRANQAVDAIGSDEKAPSAVIERAEVGS
jgi:hypothetical protein